MVALIVNLVFGALITLGIGNYAPSLVLFSLLGMDPRAAFPNKGAAIDTLDDVERQFLEPVARYLAILREWSLERRPQEPEAGPPSEQP